jgi:hypothetical protein
MGRMSRMDHWSCRGRAFSRRRRRHASLGALRHALLNLGSWTRTQVIGICCCRGGDTGVGVVAASALIDEGSISSWRRLLIRSSGDGWTDGVSIVEASSPLRGEGTRGGKRERTLALRGFWGGVRACCSCGRLRRCRRLRCVIHSASLDG